MKSGIRPRRTGIRGFVDSRLARRLDVILTRTGQRPHREFVAATEDVAGTQARVLREILAYARDTEFGRRHRFGAIAGYPDYTASVPVHDYEDLRPLIDRHAKGEEGLLFPGKPLMYNRSSGTTAKPKLIPVTPYNYDKTIRDRGKLWLYGLLRNYPGIYAGKSFSIVSPAVDGHTEDGTPYGSISGVIRQGIPEFMKLTHAVPFVTTAVEDYPARAYAMLRFAVPCDVTLMLTANPATVQNLVAHANAWKEDLIRDIRDGTLKADIDIDPALRKQFEARFEPAPERAAELDRIAASKDRFAPKDYWPNLALLHTWKCGNTAVVIPKIRPWFREDLPILEFGYLATEVMATDLIDPETDGSILQVRTAFYEFSPLEHGDRSDRSFLLAHELEVGRRYFVYVSTFSGLYRYDLNDVVEVVGKFNQAPILKFQFKGKGMTSLQGEKLSENQMVQAVAMASQETGVGHEFFIGYADIERSGYTLYVELAGGCAQERIDAFASAADKALGRLNIEYQAKRETERLRPLRVIDMGEGFFARYQALRIAEGTNEGQMKWLQLSGTEATRQRLDRLARR